MRVRWLSALSATAAFIITAPSAFADTESIRFEYGENGTWTVPNEVTEVIIEAAGAGGGGTKNTLSGAENAGGAGALVSATVTTAPGDVLTVGIGGGGSGYQDHSGGGGGGGASIVTGTDLMIIAGGGGGAGVSGAGGIGGGANGRGGNGGPTGQAFGKGGKDGIGGKTNHWHASFQYTGRDFVLGDSTDDGRGFGGAAIGGAGSAFSNYNYGGLGGAGYGGGAAGTWGGQGYSRGGGAGGSTAQGASVDVTTITYSAEGGAGGIGNVNGQAGWITITWFVASPPQSSNGAGRSSMQRAQPVALQLSTPAGVACEGPPPPDSGGWVRLPANEDCVVQRSSRASDENQEARLLGWATAPDFPVSVAQRQSDNGWGAYERRHDDGSLRAVFIPGGGWTRVTADTNLFPIWAD